MENNSLYFLGVSAKAGNDEALLKIIDKKRNFIKKMSYGDEDRYQYIVLKLIKGIKNYKY
ncbi:MAG: helix-turn-helix domain-containing protein [Clostridia bacterium]